MSAGSERLLKPGSFASLLASVIGLLSGGYLKVESMLLEHLRGE